jgi:uncharacterized delta-60 repeat protein
VACVGLAICTPTLRAPAGLLDATFGTGGKVLTKNANSFGQAVDAVAIQSYGKIVVAGSLNGNVGLVRYTTNGGLDTTFGSGGIVSMSPGGSAVDVILGIVIQSDGKILAAGPANAGNDFFVIRLNANGLSSANNMSGVDSMISNGLAGRLQDVTSPLTRLLNMLRANAPSA